MVSGAGGRVESDIGTLVLEVHAAWLYDIVTDTQEITSTYTGAGGAFKTNGVDPARHRANLGGERGPAHNLEHHLIGQLRC